MGILLTDGKPQEKYSYIPYPKFIEHADGRTCVVPHIEAHRAMGEGWTPVEGDSPVDPPVDPPVDAVEWVRTEFGADDPKPRKRKARE